MVTGVLKVSLYTNSTHSLKEKRKIIKSIVGRVRNKFNVSIAEVGANDKWQIMELGISIVCNDKRFANSVLDNILSFIDSLNLCDLIDQNIEIFNN